MAVIVDASSPRELQHLNTKSKRSFSKFMVSLQLRDATCEFYVKVNMFGYSENDLPCVTAIGDLIYLIGAKK